MNASAHAMRARASAVLAQEDTPVSPCVSICRMGDDGLCEGCWRSLDEIAEWSDLDAAQRRAVWAQIAQRTGASLARERMP